MIGNLSPPPPPTESNRKVSPPWSQVSCEEPHLGSERNGKESKFRNFPLFSFLGQISFSQIKYFALCTEITQYLGLDFLNCKDKLQKGSKLWRTRSILYSQWVAVRTLGIWTSGNNSNSYPYKTYHCCLVSMSIQEDKTKIDGDKTQNI